MTHGLVPAIIIHEPGVPDEVTDLLRRPNTYAEFQSPA